MVPKNTFERLYWDQLQLYFTEVIGYLKKRSHTLNGMTVKPFSAAANNASLSIFLPLL